MKMTVSVRGRDYWKTVREVERDKRRMIYSLAPVKTRAGPNERNLEITRRYNAGEPLAFIARDFGISKARVQHIAWSLGGYPRLRTIRGIKIRSILNGTRDQTKRHDHGL